MKVQTWAGAVVLAGYLASDLVLDPPVSSVAIAGLALGEFLVLLAVGKREPFLLAEGAALGAVDYAAMLVGTAGAGVMLLELAGGAALLASSLAGRPLLARYARRVPLLPSGGGMIERVNLAFGVLLLLHGVAMLAMTLTGGVRTVPAAALFLLLYVAVLVLMRRAARSEAARTLPRIGTDGEGPAVLLTGDRVLAELELEGDRIVTVRNLRPAGEGDAPGDLLRPLETALAMAGARTVRFEEWPGEDIQLEIAGYHRVEEVWQKVLPASAGRRVSI